MASKTKIRLKGHESFYIREGWIRKAIRALETDELILAKSNAIDELGIGANMVKAMRYWLPTIGLTEEVRVEGAKRAQKLTENFGEIIIENDRFIEDTGSLALLHYKLCTNFDQATSWYLFFNRVKADEFDKSDLPGLLEQQLLNIDPELSFSDKSLNDDCNCIIKTYCYDKEDLKNPEDNLVSPFTELGLIKKVKGKGKEETIIKTSPNKKNIDKLIILYVMLDQLKGANTVTIERLLEEECNVGKVFNLDKNIINEYIDDLESEEYITVNRTAGLNTIYFGEITKEEVLVKYYTR